MIAIKPPLGIKKGGPKKAPLLVEVNPLLLHPLKHEDLFCASVHAH